MPSAYQLDQDAAMRMYRKAKGLSPLVGDAAVPTTPGAAPTGAPLSSLANISADDPAMRRLRPSPAVASAPSVQAGSQYAQTVEPQVPPGARAEINLRDDQLSRDIGRFKYLQSKGRQMGVDTEGMVRDRFALADEGHFADIANQKPRPVLQPSDNAAIEKGKVSDLMKQIATSDFGKAGDPGYQRALESFGKMGLTNDPEDVGYAKLGQEITGRQRVGTNIDTQRIAQAGDEYAKHANARKSEEAYGIAGTAAVRGASLANVGAVQSEAERRKALADAMKDPTIAASIAKSFAAKNAADANRATTDATVSGLEGQNATNDAAFKATGTTQAALEERAGNLIGGLKTGFSTLDPRGGVLAGGTVGGANDYLDAANKLDVEVSTLERAAKSSPQGAAESARRLVAQLPLTSQNGEYIPAEIGASGWLATTGPLLPLFLGLDRMNAPKRKRATDKLNNILRRLNALAGN